MPLPKFLIFFSLIIFFNKKLMQGIFILLCYHFRFCLLESSFIQNYCFNSFKNSWQLRENVNSQLFKHDVKFLRKFFPPPSKIDDWQLENSVLQSFFFRKTEVLIKLDFLFAVHSGSISTFCFSNYKKTIVAFPVLWILLTMPWSFSSFAISWQGIEDGPDLRRSSLR